MRKIREKREGKRWRKFYRATIVFTGTSAAHKSWSRDVGSDRWQRSRRGGRRRRPSARREDDDNNLNTAQKAELAGLLEESCSTLGEGDLQGPFLLDFFYLYLLSSHALFVRRSEKVTSKDLFFFYFYLPSSHALFVRRLEKVTSKDLFFSIFFISIFYLPMLCFFTIFVFAKNILYFFTLCLWSQLQWMFLTGLIVVLYR